MMCAAATRCIAALSILKQAVRYADSLPHPGAIAALRFLLEQPEVTSVLVGMTQRRHVELNIQALACEMA